MLMTNLLKELVIRLFHPQAHKIGLYTYCINLVIQGLQYSYAVWLLKGLCMSSQMNETFGDGWVQPGTLLSRQDVLEIIEIHLPLPLKYWHQKDVCSDNVVIGK